MGAERAFAEKLVGRPEVVGAWNVTGRTDFVVMVNVPSIASYEAFSDEVFSQDANVASFETLITLRKFTRFDPLRAGHEDLRRPASSMLIPTVLDVQPLKGLANKHSSRCDMVTEQSTAGRCI